MKENKDSVNGTRLEQSEINKFRIEDLNRTVTNKINYLERRIEILEILVGKMADRSGMKIEKFQNGLVIISQ